MTLPSRKKKVHDIFSPKIASKRRARRDAQNKEASNPKPPATVNNYVTNKPQVARSLNIQPVQAEKKRVVAKTEGMPAVNAKSGDKVVQKAVTKIKPKTKEPDYTKAVAKPTAKKSTTRKKRSSRKTTPK